MLYYSLPSSHGRRTTLKMGDSLRSVPGIEVCMIDISAMLMFARRSEFGSDHWVQRHFVTSWMGEGNICVRSLPDIAILSTFTC